MSNYLYRLLLPLILCAGSLSAQPYTPGLSYFGTNGYVEYLAGNLPIILTAPHGGLLTPATIPDRDCSGCSYVNDFNTQELTRALAQALHARTGCWPHVVFNKLHRRKLDANRDLEEAADGNPTAGVAWQEFHAFVETAKNSLLPQFGKGLYIDMHGHAHTVQRLELGYLLYQSELQLPDSILNTPQYVGYSSIRNLAQQNAMELTHAELLRGPFSLGELLASRGYPATPALSDPFPDDGEDYFSGGYNTARHGSEEGGSIDGLQIECNRAGVRDSLHNVNRFADSLAVAILQYLELHYFGEVAAGLCAANVADPGVSTFFEVYPNPWCAQFFVKIGADAPGSSWQVQVHDFYGNLLIMSDLQPGIPLEIQPKMRQHLYVTLWHDGVLQVMKPIFRYCR